MPKWTAGDIVDHNGRIALITGANSGLGLEMARVLAQKNATVIMACRDVKKGEEARQQLLQANPDADLIVMRLDLGDLDSVRSFAAEFRNQYDRIDILCNNAGVMGIPRSETKQGFEMQFGVNHLGHFALTGLLLDLIKDVRGSRIVTMSSTAAWMGKIHFDDLQLQKSYSRYGAYGQSKLANLLFARELQRKLESVNSPTISTAVNPGFSITGLQHRAAHDSGSPLEWFVYNNVARVISQPVEIATLSQLYAAAAPNVEGGGFYGPERLHIWGYPKKIAGPRAGWDENVSRRLWQVSEQLTGVQYTMFDKQMA